MCGLHWSRVPKGLRRDVQWAFDQWCRGEGTLADLRHVQNAAVAAVTGKPAHKPTLCGPPEEEDSEIFRTQGSLERVWPTPERKD